MASGHLLFLVCVQMCIMTCQMAWDQASIHLPLQLHRQAEGGVHGEDSGGTGEQEA